MSGIVRVLFSSLQIYEVFSNYTNGWQGNFEQKWRYICSFADYLLYLHTGTTINIEDKVYDDEKTYDCDDEESHRDAAGNDADDNGQRTE